MSRRSVYQYFEQAKNVALSKENNRAFILGVIGIRNDGVVVSALNSTTKFPDRNQHAEKRILQKLDYGAPAIYIVRVKRLDHTFALSKPCFDCLKALISKNVQRVFYSIGEGQYGVFDDLQKAMRQMKNEMHALRC